MALTKGEKTRNRLLETASRLISEEGLERLTVRSLAQAARVSPGLVTRYFPQTDLIFPAMIRYIFEEARENIKTPPDLAPEQWFAAAVRQNFKYFINERMHHNRCVFYAYLRAGFDRETGEYFREVVESSIERVKERVLKMAAARELKISDLEARDYAASFMQRMDGGLNHSGLLANKADRVRYSTEYAEAEERRLQEFLLYLKLR